MDSASDCGKAAADQQQPHSPQPTTTNDKNHNPLPQKGAKEKTASIAGWATGWTPTKMAVNELVSVGKGFGWVFTMFTGLWTKRTAEAEADNLMAQQAPERFWDELVKTADITPESLKSRYRLAYWVDYLVLVALALGIGFTAANAGANSQTIISVALCNLIFVMHMVQVHKLYIAREQRVIPLRQLLRLTLKRPSLFLPEPLPADYRLRQAHLNPVDQEDR